MEHTRLNCQLTSVHRALPHCTIGPYMGLPSVDGRALCTPADVIANPTSFYVYDENDVLQMPPDPEFALNNDACPHDCIRTDYKAHVTQGEFDIDSLGDFLFETDPRWAGEIGRIRANEIAK